MHAACIGGIIKQIRLLKHAVATAQRTHVAGRARSAPERIGFMPAKPPTDSWTLKTIAYIHNDFPTKFGLPRQSGMLEGCLSTIVFETAYRNADALRGIEGYSHIWLIWGFSQMAREGFTPMVRPPRLGGNRRIGVFATRSPNRPNPLGLTCVKLESIAHTQQGTVLTVSGADMMDGTPIYDIKPYLAYADAIPQATGGFTDESDFEPLQVVFPEQWLSMIPQDRRATLLKVLQNDPRPAYQHSAERVYGFFYAGLNVRFRVADKVLTVWEITPMDAAPPSP